MSNAPPPPARSLDKAVTILNNTSPALVVKLSLQADDGQTNEVQQLRREVLQAQPHEFERKLQHLMHAGAKQLLRSTNSGLESLVSEVPKSDEPFVRFWLYDSIDQQQRLHRVNQKLGSYQGRILIDEFKNYESLREHIVTPMLDFFDEADPKTSHGGPSSVLGDAPSMASELRQWLSSKTSSDHDNNAVDRRSLIAARSLHYLTWQQVDVDRALIIIRHSVKPLLTALQYSRMYRAIAEEMKEYGVKDDLCVQKSQFFDALAAEMGNRIPDGRLFRNDRANVLGSDFKKGRSPLELAVVWGNHTFVSSAASMTFAKDVWNDPPFSLLGRKLLTAYFVYPSYMARSPAARLTLTAIVQVTIAALLWFNSNLISTNPSIFDDAEFDFSFIGLYILAAGQILEELFEFLRALWDELNSSDDTQQGIKKYINAIPDAGLRYMTVDPWNIVDIATACLFILALGFRAAGQTTAVFYVFALTLIPTFIRPLYVLEFHRKLGPLIRSIYNMAADVFRFFAMWSVILLSFAIAFSLLFYDVPSGAFVTYTDSMITLLSASLGEFDFSAHRADGEDTKNFIGTTLLIIHLALTHVLGLNLLVAIMTSVYERFRDNSIEQYRFGHVRTVLRFTTAVVDHELSTPFNLIQVLGDFLFAWPIAACASTRLMKRQQQRDKLRGYKKTVSRVRRFILGLGTDMLVMVSCWILFSPFMVLSLVFSLLQLCVSRGRRDKALSRMLNRGPSNTQSQPWLGFSHFTGRCRAWCHFFMCDRPIKARKKHLRWPQHEYLFHQEEEGSSTVVYKCFCIRRLERVQPAQPASDSQSKERVSSRNSTPPAVHLLRIKILAMQQMLARIFEAQGVIFSTSWEQHFVQHHLKLATNAMNQKADPTFEKNLRDKIVSSFGITQADFKSITPLDLARLLGIGHAMLDLQESNTGSSPSLNLLLGSATKNKLNFAGRVKARRFSRILKLKVGAPSSGARTGLEGASPSTEQRGPGAASAYFVFLQLLPEVPRAGGSRRKASQASPPSSPRQPPLSLLGTLVRSIKDPKASVLGGEMWERSMLRGNTSRSKDVYGVSSRQHLIEATLLLESSPLARHTYKAWLLEEFHDCCRWEVDKDKKMHTIPRRLIAKVNPDVDFGRVGEEDEVDAAHHGPVMAMEVGHFGLSRSADMERKETSTSEVQPFRDAPPEEEASGKDAAPPEPHPSDSAAPAPVVASGKAKEGSEPEEGAGAAVETLRLRESEDVSNEGIEDATPAPEDDSKGAEAQQ